MLSALAFVLKTKVIKYFEKHLDTKYFIDSEIVMIPLIDYFKGNWIGRLQRKRREYPINMCNCLT